MKEQVKAWIEDKRLTADSYDSLMIGVIYNSGHHILDDPDVRKWIEMHPDELREMLPFRFNANQQTVLEWFKNRYIDYNERLSTIIYFLTVHYPYGTDEHLSVKRIFRKLSKQEEAQVLQAFANWALEQEGK
ncbi:hypothetical protein [Enterococcus sp. SMC-9]|uniref:hypothetical protein n=1 Tax=Enterococcus sp. SMC-9 TaxID=2862343 RepID=UPI001E50A132|nr:hypothetical protein [Enterococcus sp. SMC-9]MCD1025726.1 hypothetical protein [Enterococcus sp. SMC-9]